MEKLEKDVIDLQIEQNIQKNRITYNEQRIDNILENQEKHDETLTSIGNSMASMVTTFKIIKGIVITVVMPVILMILNVIIDNLNK